MIVAPFHSVSGETRDDARSSGRSVPGGVSSFPPPGTTFRRVERDRELLCNAGLSSAEIDQIIMGRWA